MYRTTPRRPNGRTSVMVVKTLDEGSPRCPSSDHPALMPHQLADVYRMKEIESSCHNLLVPSVCFSEAPASPVAAAAPPRLLPGPEETGAADASAAASAAATASASAAATAASTAAEAEVRATVRMGILADKPGAGKSFTVMEMLLISEQPSATEVYHHVSAHMSYRTTRQQDEASAHVSVLVFPHNLSKQWQDLLAKRVPENRLAFASRAAAVPGVLAAIDSAAGVAGAPPLPAAGPPPDGYSPRGGPGGLPLVVAATATNFPAILGHLAAKRITVARIVYDEADSLRLTRCQGQSQVARFHWFVTASPHNLYSVIPEHGTGFGVFSGGRVEYRHAAGASQQSLMYGCPYVYSAYVRDFFVSGSSNSLAVHNCLCAITVMSDDAFVDASFDVPAPEVTLVMCRSEARSSLLHGIVNNAVIDRLNAGDVRGALAVLNPSCVASSETNVVAVAAKSLETALSNLRAQLQYVSARAYADDATRDAAAARIEGRIRSTAAQIESLEQRIRGADVCPICYDDSITNKTVAPCCSNSFCLACITRWLLGDGRGQRGNPSCPMCKSHLDPKALLVICPEPEAAAEAAAEAEAEAAAAVDAEAAAEAEGEPSGSGAIAGAVARGGFVSEASLGKIDNLRRLVSHFAAEAEATGEPRRILVFSDNDEIMGRVSREVMTREGVAHAFLKSNANVINARTREFRETRGVYALLTNIKFYGSGLDLSAATDIVLMHKVQESMSAQVIGRAQRPPRSQPLRIWKFRNDLEEEY